MRFQSTYLLFWISFKANRIPISENDLRDAIDAGFVKEICVEEENQLSTKVNYEKLKKLFPSIRIMNAVRKINEAKSSGRAF